MICRSDGYDHLVRSLAVNHGLLLGAFAVLFVAGLTTNVGRLFAAAGVCIGLWGGRVVSDYRGVGSEWARWRRSTELAGPLKGVSDRGLMFLEGGIAVVIGIGCLVIGFAA